MWHDPPEVRKTSASSLSKLVPPAADTMPLVDLADLSDLAAGVAPVRSRLIGSLAGRAIR